jgi:hypothetical protein
MEIYQFYGSDIQLNQQAQIRLVTGDLETYQRVYRRLITVPGTYIWDVNYGAGLPTYIGQNLSGALAREIKGRIKTNMFKETTVARNPEPVITVKQSGNVFEYTIVYTSQTSGNVYTLNFSV